MMRRLSIGRAASVGAFLASSLVSCLFWSTGALAAPTPKLAASLVRQLETAQMDLAESLAAVSQKPDKALIRKAEASMDTIDHVVDGFFHATNLRAVRDTAEALRPAIQRLRAGDEAVLILVDDVLHFRPDVHLRLANALTQLGDAPGALKHHLAVVAGGATREHIEAALVAADAARDAKATAGLKHRLLQFKALPPDPKP